MNEYRKIREHKHKSIRARETCARLHLYVFAGMTLAACLIVFLSVDIFGSARANESLKTNPVADTQSSAGPASGTQVGDLKRQLRQNSLSPPNGQNEGSVPTGTIDDDLRKIIAQIRSAKIGQEQPVQVAEDTEVLATEHTKPLAESHLSEIETTETQKEINPVKNETSVSSVTSVADNDSAAKNGWQGTEGKIDATNPSSAISDLTLRTIDDLLNDPNKSQSLTTLDSKQVSFQYRELAEVLFKSGRFSEAGQCYKRAYELFPDNDANLVGDKNWILFQIGNCFEYDDPNTARENFAQLIRTNPSSPWADVAKFRHDLADWMQKEQPKKLIEEMNRKSENSQ